MMIKKDINQFNENFFKMIGQDYALLSAGSVDKFNTMTIGWATIGYIWGKNVLTCYVRPSRHTYLFTESNDYFTVAFFDESFKKTLNYLGAKSGRDEDKVKKCDLNVMEIDNSISFKEARLTIVCKKIYHQDLDPAQIPDEVKARYYPKGDFHRFYIGEVINIYEN